MRTNLQVIWTLVMTVISCGGGSIISARCHSKCLSTHFSSATLHTNRSRLLQACSSHLNCSSCIYPCNIFKNLPSCKQKCQDATQAPDVCSESCTFIKTIRHEKTGSCPSVQGDKKWIETACVQACTVDTDCHGNKKCCDNGCGQTCQSPDTDRKNYPRKVDRGMTSVMENRNEDSATVSWSHNSPLDVGEVVLFVVQALNNTQHRGKASWLDVGMVEDTQLRIPLLLGRHYQFKVAAVNQNGSIGFSRPTVSFHLTRDPNPPEPPHSILAGSWWPAGNERKMQVNMTIHWEPPKHTDLPVSKYRVFYSERRPVQPVIISVPERRIDVSGGKTSVVLPFLEPRMKYFVQVMGIARFENTRLSSNRASVYLFTPDIPIRDTTGETTEYTRHAPVSPMPSGAPRPGPPVNLTAGRPYWVNGMNGSLKVLLRWRKPRGYEDVVNRFTIHWEPTVCSSSLGSESEGTGTSHGLVNNDIYRPYQQRGATTHDTQFELFDLSFDCAYQVWVRPVYRNSWGPAHATIQFLTPPCSEVQAIGIKPVCPTSIPDIPSAPQNLSYSYSISETVSAHLRWDPPSHTLHPLTGYRIDWGQVKPRLDFRQMGIPTIEREDFTSKILEEMQHSYTITNLKAGSRYVVKLMALSSIGGGAVVAVDIETPNITMATHPNIDAAVPSYRPPAVSSQPGRNASATASHAPERLVLPTLYLYLLVILCTYYIIQR